MKIEKVERDSAGDETELMQPENPVQKMASQVVVVQVAPTKSDQIRVEFF